MVWIVVEYRMRHGERARPPVPTNEENGRDTSSSSSDDDDGEHGSRGRNCDCLRLCIIFLAFDVFFVVFCVALACIIGIVVCCCLPCITQCLIKRELLKMCEQEGASEDDIRQLPKFKFRRVEEPEKRSVSVTGSFGGIMVDVAPTNLLKKHLQLKMRSAAFASQLMMMVQNSESTPVTTIFILLALISGCISMPHALFANTMFGNTPAAVAAKKYESSCENIEHSNPSMPVSAAGNFLLECSECEFISPLL